MTKTLTKSQLDMFQSVESMDPTALLRKQLLAGSAKFTLTSKATGKRFTYWIRSGALDRDKNWSTNNQNHCFYFVKVLNGPDNSNDYLWIASLKRQSADSIALSFDARYQYASAPSRYPIEWLLRKLFVVGVVPDDAEILFASSCLRCGRTLTVPESIKSGFGPECVGMVM